MAIAVAPTDTLDQKRLLKVLSDYRRGDFSPRMPSDRTGIAGKICDALNEAIDRNEKLVKELERLSNVVGKAGNIKQRAAMPSVLVMLLSVSASAAISPFASTPTSF